MDLLLQEIEERGPETTNADLKRLKTSGHRLNLNIRSDQYVTSVKVSMDNNEKSKPKRHFYVDRNASKFLWKEIQDHFDRVRAQKAKTRSSSSELFRSMSTGKWKSTGDGLIGIIVIVNDSAGLLWQWDVRGDSQDFCAIKMTADEFINSTGSAVTFLEQECGCYATGLCFCPSVDVDCLLLSTLDNYKSCIAFIATGSHPWCPNPPQASEVRLPDDSTLTWFSENATSHRLFSLAEETSRSTIPPIRGALCSLALTHNFC